MYLASRLIYHLSHKYNTIFSMHTSYVLPAEYTQARGVRIAVSLREQSGT